MSDNLRTKLKGHFAGIVFMGIFSVSIVSTVDINRDKERDFDPRMQMYLDAKDVDFGNPIDRSLFRESLDLFYPRQTLRNDSLVKSIDDMRERLVIDPAYKTGKLFEGLSPTMIIRLSTMFLQFLIVYAVVLACLYFAAQRIAIYRFVKMKQHHESYLAEFFESFRTLQFNLGTEEFLKRLSLTLTSLLKALGKGVLMLVLFSPAYVIAYSLKTTLDTSSLVFMTLLAVISNGVLIHTSNKFFLLLLAESRKGYVNTAIVKGLSASYEWNTNDGIAKRSLFRARNMFSSHVFGHILHNAKFQFIPTFKEHASFLVTGLIIIEMALNIQGHLCYELLQQILFRQYDVAVVIIFGIFLVVKSTEILVDVWHDRERKKYGY